MYKNIYEYTESQNVTLGYVGYISINERKNKSVWISVGTRGGLDVSEIELPKEELKRLKSSIDTFISEDS